MRSVTLNGQYDNREEHQAGLVDPPSTDYILHITTAFLLPGFLLPIALLLLMLGLRVHDRVAPLKHDILTETSVKKNQYNQRYMLSLYIKY